MSAGGASKGRVRKRASEGEPIFSPGVGVVQAAGWNMLPGRMAVAEGRAENNYCCFLQKSEFCQFRLDTGACQPRLTEPAVQQLDQPPASELKRSRSSECEIIAICLATALDGVHW